MNVPDNYEIYFMQGGATEQFGAVPMNLAKGKKGADYLMSGYWSLLASWNAKKYLKVNEVNNMIQGGWQKKWYDPKEWNVDKDAAYFHYCDNETVAGYEIHDFPFDAVPEGVPIVTDCSSSVGTKHIDVSKHGIIYFGAQKNMGAPGVTVVMIRDDLIGNALDITPYTLDYGVYKDDVQRIFNTPTTHSVFLMNLYLKWTIEQGGIDHFKAYTDEQSNKIYSVVDEFPAMYSNPMDKDVRSTKNITFEIKGKDGQDLDEKFVKDSWAAGIRYIAKHRTHFGVRISIYNATPAENVDFMADFMRKWYQENKHL